MHNRLRLSCRGKLVHRKDLRIHPSQQQRRCFRFGEACHHITVRTEIKARALSVACRKLTALVRNRDALANNRVKQFSNAAFADQWYALFLEEPKVRYERRAPTRFGRFG